MAEVFRIINAHSRQVVDNPIQRVLATGVIVGLANHTVLIARDGTERQIADSAAPIHDDRGRIVGVVLVIRDVTEEYALQEQVRQSQKMEAIGQLAGGIAHDFNNLLGGIQGAAELLRPRIMADARNDRYVGMILDAAQRAAGLTAKLLAFARRQSLAMGPVDAHQAVRDTVAMLENTLDRRIVIRSELAPGQAMVHGDLAQLQSVFLNLGINASHAMPQGGTLTFRSRRSADPQSDNARIAIEVQDTGTGIDPAHLPRIFEPFFTTKAPGSGTGLGLSASLGTIQQHAGTIEVASTVGVGSTFTVLLPLCAVEVPEAEAAPAPAHGVGRILLVDDEEVLRSVGRVMLEGFGYHVLVAEHGAAAVGLFTSGQQDVDLVILDMNMPVMNGRDCLAALRRIRPGIKVIIASGYAPTEDREQWRREGASGFIGKPYLMDELGRIVARVLRGEPGSGQCPAQPPRPASP
jgi:signal transduction histidine kinase/ActR/RegA family two-component response regulator